MYLKKNHNISPTLSGGENDDKENKNLDGGDENKDFVGGEEKAEGGKDDENNKKNGPIVEPPNEYAVQGGEKDDESDTSQLQPIPHEGPDSIGIREYVPGQSEEDDAAKGIFTGRNKTKEVQRV